MVTFDKETIEFEYQENKHLATTLIITNNSEQYLYFKV
jgi:hypothetical protein